MNCPKCGAENNKNNKFCKECGTKLSKKSIPEKMLFCTLIILLILLFYIVITNILGNYNSSKIFQKELNNQDYTGYKIVVQISQDSKIKSFFGNSNKGYIQLTNLLDTKYGYCVQGNPHCTGDSIIGAMTKDKAIIYIKPNYSKEEIVYFLTTPKLIFKKLDKNNRWVETGLNSRGIKKSSIWSDFDNVWAVEIKFNERGKEKLTQITKELIGKPLGVFYSDQLIISPKINEAITSGKVQITGGNSGFTYKEARDITNTLNQRLDLDVIEVQTNIKGR